MTYFGFLLRFIVIPIVLLLVVWWFARKRTDASGFLGDRAAWLAIGLHVLLAVVYTTPWDNYLVATGVWYYNPNLISGLLLGWVPIEEYIFFMVETILVGVWWLFLTRVLKSPADFQPRPKIRMVSILILGIIWAANVVVLAAGMESGTYLALILTWALPPIMLQLAFGADILWHYRKLVLAVILPVLFYISGADSLAISEGTWTIDINQSTGIFIGALPAEELIFFLVTIVLITFGLTLALSAEGQARLHAARNTLLKLKNGLRGRSLADQ